MKVPKKNQRKGTKREPTLQNQAYLAAMPAGILQRRAVLVIYNVGWGSCHQAPQRFLGGQQTNRRRPLLARGADGKEHRKMSISVTYISIVDCGQVHGSEPVLVANGETGFCFTT